MSIGVMSKSYLRITINNPSSRMTSPISGNGLYFLVSPYRFKGNVELPNSAVRVSKILNLRRSKQSSDMMIPSSDTPGSDINAILSSIPYRYPPNGVLVGESANTVSLGILAPGTKLLIVGKRLYLNPKYLWY